MQDQGPMLLTGGNLLILFVCFRLLTPPGTPLFPSLEMESQRTVMSQIGTPKALPTVLKSRVRVLFKLDVAVLVYLCNT